MYDKIHYKKKKIKRKKKKKKWEVRSFPSSDKEKYIVFLKKTLLYFYYLQTNNPEV